MVFAIFQEDPKKKAIREFRNQYPQYEKWTDEEIEKGLTETQPEKYKAIFTETKLPKSDTELQAAETKPALDVTKQPKKETNPWLQPELPEMKKYKEAVKAVKQFKIDYPQYETWTDTEIAKGLEENLPDKYTGISNHIDKPAGTYAVGRGLFKPGAEVKDLGDKTMLYTQKDLPGVTRAPTDYEKILNRPVNIPANIQEEFRKADKVDSMNIVGQAIQGVKEGLWNYELSHEFYKRMSGLPNKADEIEAKMSADPNVLNQRQELYNSWKQDRGAISKFFRSAVRGGATQLPLWVLSYLEGLKWGAQGAVGAGSAAAAGGQPEAILPMAAAGFGVGLQSGMINDMKKMEAGSAYDEYTKMGIEPNIARNIAEGVGLVNGFIEFAQFGEALAAFGKPGKDIVNKVKQNVIKRMIKSYAGTMAEETGEEVLQRAVTIGGQEMSKAASSQEFKHITGPEVFKQLSDEAVGAATSFSLLLLPGTFVHGLHSTMIKPEQADRLQTELSQAAEKKGKKPAPAAPAAARMSLREELGFKPLPTEKELETRGELEPGQAAPKETLNIDEEYAKSKGIPVKVEKPAPAPQPKAPIRAGQPQAQPAEQVHPKPVKQPIPAQKQAIQAPAAQQVTPGPVEQAKSEGEKILLEHKPETKTSLGTWEEKGKGYTPIDSILMNTMWTGAKGEEQYSKDLHAQRDKEQDMLAGKKFEKPRVSLYDVKEKMPTTDMTPDLYGYVISLLRTGKEVPAELQMILGDILSARDYGAGFNTKTKKYEIDEDMMDSEDAEYLSKLDWHNLPVSAREGVPAGKNQVVYYETKGHRINKKGKTVEYAKKNFVTIKDAFDDNAALIETPEGKQHEISLDKLSGVEYDSLSKAEKAEYDNLKKAPAVKKEKIAPTEKEKPPAALQEEFKVGDILDPQGKTNMVGQVTISEISENTIKFVDSAGTEYSGMQRSLVKTLINAGSWKKVETEIEKPAPEQKKGEQAEVIGQLKEMIASGGFTRKQMSEGGQAEFQVKDNNLYIDGKKVLKAWESYSGWYWFATEKVQVQDSVIDDVTYKDDQIWYGFVQGLEEEWGDFSQAELESLGNRVWPIKKQDLIYSGKRAREETPAAAEAPKPEPAEERIQKPGEVYTGKAYRAESELMIKGKTAQEIVDFEAEELGNADTKAQAESTGLDLKSILEEEVIWVTKKLEDAKRYGDHAEEVPVSKAAIILAYDEDGGYLLYNKPAEPGELKKDLTKKEISDITVVDRETSETLTGEQTNEQTGGETNEVQDGIGQVKVRDIPGPAADEGKLYPGRNRRLGRGEPAVRPGIGKPAETPAKRGAARGNETWRNLKLSLDKPIELTVDQRRTLNEQARQILEKPLDNITQADREILRQYTGLGGLQAAEEGVLNQHYTPYKIINFMWNKIAALGMKYQDKKALEAAGGVGNFIGFKPSGVKFDVVEMDETASKISKILYPEETHYNMPFERFVIGDRYDISIGNDPFGNFRGKMKYDEEAEEYKSIKSIHDFFLTKRIDLLKPNGILADVISTGFMDKLDTVVREKINRKAEFLGAYRLPAGVFSKNTQYEGSVDVVFFRKRTPEEIGKNPQKEFINTARITLKNTKGQETQQHISEYYNIHPENLWGDLFIVGQYGQHVGVKKATDAQLENFISKALKDGMTYKPKKTEYSKEQGGQREADEISAGEAPANAKVGMFINKDGNIYEVDASRQLYKLDLPEEGTTITKIKASVKLMEYADKFNENPNQADRLSIQKQLNNYFKTYGKAPGWDRTLARLRTDPRYWKLSGYMNAEGKLADIIVKEKNYQKEFTISLPAPGDLKDTVRYIREKYGKYDIELIGKELGEDAGTLKKRLVSELGWNIAGEEVIPDEEYLYGDLYPKIDQAQEAGLTGQVDKLKAALPEQLTFKQIPISLVYTWLPIEIKNMWLKAADIGGKFVRKVNPANGLLEWDIEDGSKWGGVDELRINRNSPIDAILKFMNHNREYRYEYDDKGKKVAIYDAEQTAELRKIDEHFQAWMKKQKPTGAMVKDLEDIYNRAYRGYRHELPEGAAKDIVGISDTFKGKLLKVGAHQWEWIGKALRRPTINAHGVGGGKTMAAILETMLAKQRGISKRTMIVVPAKIIRKWALEIQELFPTAKIMSLENLKEENSWKMLQAIASNDFDFALITTDRLKMIPLKASDTFIEEDLSELRNRLIALKDVKGRKGMTERYIQERMIKLEEKLAGLQDMKKTDTVFFEDLKIDGVIVDEAHNYKNVYVDWGTYSRENTIATNANSDRANDLYYKFRYMHAQGFRNLQFLTATPTPNNPIEIYSMIRYLAPQEWTDRGIRNAADFVDQFCDVNDKAIADVNGLMKTKKIIVGYKNLQDLRAIFKKYVDYRQTKDLGIELPETNFTKVEVDMSAEQMKATAKLVADMEYVRNHQKEAREAGINMLSLTTQGRQLAVGADVWDPVKYHNWNTAKSKKAVLVEKVYDYYKKYDKGQLIFLDLYQGRARLTDAEREEAKRKKLDAEVVDRKRPILINYHTEIRDMLIKKGVKPKEIAIINGDINSSPGEKERVMNYFNEGEIKVIIGTTQAMGEGMDLQADTIATHNVDVPWTPDALIQRNGRSVRQGNKNEIVEVLNYTTKGSLDAFMYGKLGIKQKWNIELWSGDADRLSNINLDEVEGLNYTEIAEGLTTNEQELSYWRSIRNKDVLNESLNKATAALEKLQDRKDNLNADITHRQERIKESEDMLQEKKTAKEDTDYVEERIKSHREHLIEDEKMLKDTEKEIKDINKEVSGYESELNETNKLIAARAAGEEIPHVESRPAEKEIKEEEELSDTQDKPDPDSVKMYSGVPVEEIAAAAGTAGKFIGKKAAGQYNTAHDFLFKYGMQKRIDPVLFDKMVKTDDEIATRISRAISIVNQRIKSVTGKGNYMTLDEAITVSFAIEEKAFPCPENLIPVRDEIVGFFEEIDKTNKAAGIYKMSFLENKRRDVEYKIRNVGTQIRRYQADIEDLKNNPQRIMSLRKLFPKITQNSAENRLKWEISRLEADRDTLVSTKGQLDDLRWITHRPLAKIIVDMKTEELTEDQLKPWLEKLRNLSFKYKHREGIIPLREFYEQNLLSKDDLNIVKIAMQVLSEASFKWTMKDLFEFAKDKEYIVPDGPGVPKHWDKIIASKFMLIAPEYENYRCNPLFQRAMLELKDEMTQKHNLFDYTLAVVKMGQFVKPAIIWKYDLLQMFLGGAYGFKTPLHLAKAFYEVMKTKITNIETPFYKDVNRRNLFQKTYLPVVGGKSETEAIDLASRRLLAMPGVVKFLEGITDMKMSWSNAHRVVTAAMRALGNFTWTGDEIIRLATVMDYETLGMTREEAVKEAVAWSGAYAEFSIKSKRIFSRIFFVYAFRFLMPRQMFRLIKAPVDIALNEISGGKYGTKYTKAKKIVIGKGIAAMIFMFAAIEYYFKQKGFSDEPEEAESNSAILGYSWVKKVKTPSGETKQVVVRLDLIYNQPIKWLARLMYNDPTKETLPEIQGFLKWAQWEIHPFYRILLDLRNNRASYGRKPIYNPNLTGTAGKMKQILQATDYFITESFKILKGPSAFTKDFFGVGFNESDYVNNDKEQREIKKRALNDFEQFMIDQFGHSYTAMDEEYYYAFSIRKLMNEMDNRLFATKELKPEHRAAAQKEIEDWAMYMAEEVKKKYEFDKKKRGAKK